MDKYNCILNKVQKAEIEIEWDENISISYLLKKIQEMKIEDLNFGPPEFVLESIMKEEGKVTKIISEVLP